MVIAIHRYLIWGKVSNLYPVQKFWGLLLDSVNFSVCLLFIVYSLLFIRKLCMLKNCIQKLDFKLRVLQSKLSDSQEKRKGNILFRRIQITELKGIVSYRRVCFPVIGFLIKNSETCCRAPGWALFFKLHGWKTDPVREVLTQKTQRLLQIQLVRFLLKVNTPGSNWGCKDKEHEKLMEMIRKF